MKKIYEAPQAAWVTFSLEEEALCAANGPSFGEDVEDW